MLKSQDESSVREEIEELIDQKIEGFDTPYLSNVEALPKLATYHPSFAKVEKRYESLLDKAVQMLQDSKYHDAGSKQLLDESLKRRKIEYPPAQKIGLVGDSGVGKSSLINAILDVPELALTTAEFVAEVVLFDHGKVKSILEGYLQDYRMASIEEKDDLDVDALEDMRNRSNTAIDVFRALFADRREFQDEAGMHLYLGRMQHSFDTVLRQMLRWTEDLISKSGTTHRLFYKSAQTASSLRESIELFMKMTESHDTPLLWPIVDIVRYFAQKPHMAIGLKTPLLERGLVIADLPGLSDMNRTRTRATNEYIRSCDYLFLVAPVARVQTDNLVDRRIMEYIHKFGSQVALICTKTDDVPLHAKSQEFSATARASWEHKELLRVYEKMTVNKAHLAGKKKAAKGKAKRDLEREYKELIMKESIILMRNRKVEIAMAARYRGTDAEAQPLKSWFVSSKEYQTNASGFDQEEIPVSIEATGLPQLRAFMLRMPAEHRLDVLKVYCWGHLPSLIGSMEMWSIQSHAHRRIELREVVAKPRKAAEVVISAFAEEVKTHLNEMVIGVIRELKSAWAQRATEQLEEIARIKWGTYRAWCTRHGKHSTPKFRDWNWNTGFLEPVLDDLEKPWERFDTTCEDVSKNCLAALTELLDGIRENLSAMTDVVVVPIEPFMKSLAPKKVQLQAVVESFSNKFKKFRRLNVTTSDTKDSYLVQALDPAYEKCSLEKGPGCYRRSVAILHDTMLMGKPFAAMEPGLQTVFDSDLDARIKKLVEKVQIVFDVVLSDFDSMFAVVERPNAERSKLRDSIKDFTHKAEATLEGPMREELAKAIEESK
ncbi:MAG: hypothetical protein Q9210_003171 [Variospora velana]